MCQARKKWAVSDVPNRKTCYDFYASTKNANTHKSHKWFAGHYSLVAGTAETSHYFD